MGLPPPIMNDILTLNQNASYNLSSGVTVSRRNIRTNKFSATGAVLWGNLPNGIPISDNVNFFKHKIKQCIHNNCLCKICKNFIKNLGYI